MGKEDINIRYEHQNNSNYLVIEDAFEYEDYQYKMLKRNKPEHFLRFSMYSVNGKYGIYYDITSRQQLSKYYEYGKMTMEDVKSICVNISEMVRIAEDYMLDLDHVKIEPKFIYMDVGTKKLQFVYHTRVNGYSFNESLKILFDFILEHFDHSLDKESIVQLYEVYQKVIVGDYDPFNLMRMFGIKTAKKKEEEPVEKEKQEKEIKTVIAEQVISDTEEKIKETGVNTRRILIGLVCIIFGLVNIFVPGLMPFKIPSIFAFICIGAGTGVVMAAKGGKGKKPQSVMVTQKQSIPYVIKEEVRQSSHKDINGIKKKDSEKEKTISYDDICNETMLLSEYMPEKNNKKKLRLILQKENLIGEVPIYTRGIENEDDAICMDKYPYVIGSFEKMSDVVIKAQVVSRMHCCIYHESFKEDEYLVEDLNATNGTYLNGERLDNHERKKLSDGDILKLAAISFKVEIS